MKAAEAAFLIERKGVAIMACNHERIKSVNCVISCVLCGKILPLDYLVARERIKAQEAEKPAQEIKAGEIPSEPVKAAETPEKGQKKATGRKPRKGSESK